jgi:hypothetical protein
MKKVIGIISIFVIIGLAVWASFAQGPPSMATLWKLSGGNVTTVGNKSIVAPTILGLTPQSLTVTTEANIALTGSLLLLTGDNDGDNDAIDLQNGTITGQLVVVVGIALIDGDDTITVAMTDTTCTGCLAVVLDEIGDTYT